MSPGGETQLAAVVGSPIHHSRSPAIFNAAFAASGLDWVFVAFEVDRAAAPGALDGARALGLRGLSVTMPLKEAMAGLADSLSPTAARLGAVNSVRLGADGVRGDNTDGGGLLDALRAARGWSPAGRTCVVLGAGGAARAVVLALADGGAAEVTVCARTPERAEAAAELAGRVGAVGAISAVGAAEVVINATPLGMAGTPSAGELAVPASLLQPGQLVVDLVYQPAETPLLAAAAARGAEPVGGMGMLVHQAARQFTWWTGMPAPIAVMERAARS